MFAYDSAHAKQESGKRNSPNYCRHSRYLIMPISSVNPFFLLWWDVSSCRYKGSCYRWWSLRLINKVKETPPHTCTDPHLLLHTGCSSHLHLQNLNTRREGAEGVNLSSAVNSLNCAEAQAKVDGNASQDGVVGGGEGCHPLMASTALGHCFNFCDSEKQRYSLKLCVCIWFVHLSSRTAAYPVVLVSYTE